MLLSNAFSINMFHEQFPDHFVSFHQISLDQARELIKACPGKMAQVQNCIGHAETDAVVRQQLGIDWLSPGIRTSVQLGPVFKMVVAQYRGPRLPEGATEIPAGSTIEWWFVTEKGQ